MEPTLAGICDMIGPLPNRPCLHLYRGYDSHKSRDLLQVLGYGADIAACSRLPQLVGRRDS